MPPCIQLVNIVCRVSFPAPERQVQLADSCSYLGKCKKTGELPLRSSFVFATVSSKTNITTRNTQGVRLPCVARSYKDRADYKDNPHEDYERHAKEFFEKPVVIGSKKNVELRMMTETNRANNLGAQR